MTPDDHRNDPEDGDRRFDPVSTWGLILAAKVRAAMEEWREANTRQRWAIERRNERRERDLLNLSLENERREAMRW